MTGDAEKRDAGAGGVTGSAADTDRTLAEVRRLAEEAAQQAQQINDLMRRLATLVERDHGQS